MRVHILRTSGETELLRAIYQAKLLPPKLNYVFLLLVVKHYSVEGINQ